MSRVSIINGQAVPNLPWEDRPASSSSVIWRYSGNPIIERDPFPSCNSVFNSAAVPFHGQYAGVFRCDNTARLPLLHAGRSKDGFHWSIDPNQITFADDGGDPERMISSYAYDPRVCEIDGRFYLTWCNGYHEATVGVAYTDDFEVFHRLENAFLPFNRNGVLFPRKINGLYIMLSRPMDRWLSAFGEIYLSMSPDLEYWGKHRWVMGTAGGWQSIKIGAGPSPIETSEGWLVIYHGVIKSCNGFTYSAGAALLDIDKPWKVVARTRPYIISPRTIYECVGDVQNVVFPCAAIADSETGRMAVYYGAADTVTALAFTRVDELVNFIKSNNLLESGSVKP